MTKKSPEIPGNSIGTAQAHQKWLMKAGNALSMLSEGFERYDEETGVVHSIRFAAPGVERSEWLAIVSVESGDGRQVAFSSGEDFMSCLVTVANRWRNGSLKWRADEYNG